jgi:hypothetical protein
MVSTICGRNIHKTPEEAVLILLQKYHRDLFDTLVNAYRFTIGVDNIQVYTREDIARSTLSVIPFKVIEEATKSITPDITSLPSDVKSEVAKFRGIYRESIVKDIIGQNFKTLVDNTHYSKHLVTTNNTPYVLGGRIDLYLVDDNNNRIGIVEIKSRTRYFKEPPIYDIDQLACYCYIMDRDNSNINKYYLVEEMEGKVYYKEFTYEFLIDRWNSELRPYLEYWVDRMYSIQWNPLQPDLIDMVNRYAIVLYNVNNGICSSDSTASC